jgi:N-acetylmuramoyl-L-alanine amidase
MLFISAGHYPARPGAGYNNFYEHDEAVLWSREIFDALTDLSKSDDPIAFEVPTGVLRDKVSYINHRAQSNSIAIEIHFNAAVDSAGNNIGKGCESLYMPGSELGQKIAKRLNDAIALDFEPNRGIKEGWYRMDKRKGADFFLEKTSCPAVIIEPEFIQHRDRIQHKRRATCKRIAEALITCGEDFFDNINED